ncbi:hypothetical protein CQ010_01280 [Arthrobacter sp. MYb211]|uniref:hypothetical protein n=1 Tax=unclassified Arthrobacter TaxID=235627 RepID=UPI000CFA85DB|nr:MULTISPECIES: hypothetical protein [unclassified Arthrobacter]PRA13306.1 hypothetical protein CQ015_03535 [Arthrobacter sp. MYb221]PRC10503.1 hypothetical protein CQ010_01280 [Arthrobacter sp. MYb211]
MTTKTFNSDSTDGRALEVGRNGERPWLNIREFDLENTMFMLAPSDAPALALAILEAAGVEVIPFDEGPETEAGHAVWALRHHMQEAEAKAAEAKDKAELEAEARDFYDVYHSAADWPYQDWVMLEERYKAQFIAVARHAREMRAEK